MTIPQNLPLTAAALRVTLVAGVVPAAGQGPSLSEIDSEALPQGALAYSVIRNAWYRLNKSSTAAVDTTSGFNNVVAASGGGNWVRTIQYAQVTLVGGTALATGLDLSGGGGTLFTVDLVVPHGTTGNLYAAPTSLSTATITSTNGADTSLVLLQVVSGTIA